MRTVETQVLIVGAGPVGMTASLLLARLGVPSLVVERREGLHTAPQAHVVNPRTLEICRVAGIDMSRLAEAATAREDSSRIVWMTTLAGEELGSLSLEREFRENARHTPTPLLNISQHVFEPILLDHLRRQPAVEVRFGQQWTELEQDGHGVTSIVEDLASGERVAVRSRYVVAADGAGSRVRKALGIDMIGPDSIQSFVMIHFAANLRDLVRANPALLYWIMDPLVQGVFIAHDIERTWVFMHPHDPQTQPSNAYTREACARIVRDAIGTGAGGAASDGTAKPAHRRDIELEVRDVSFWTMTAQVAERFAAGRVFLIGDSAHRFPPTGGLGMNTGIQDAHNLAWKLAAVEAGWAPPSLLDTYESERRPVAQRNADHSVNNAMKMWEVFQALGILPHDRDGSKARMDATLANAEGRQTVRLAIERQRDHFEMLGLQLGFIYDGAGVCADGSEPPRCENSIRDYVPTTRPGARLPHAWIKRDGERVSTLDLVAYDRFTLFAGSRAGSAWQRAAAAASSQVRCLIEGRDFTDPDRTWQALCGISADGALLVRPDQHVAWRCKDGCVDPATELHAALRAVVHAASVRDASS